MSVISDMIFRLVQLESRVLRNESVIQNERIRWATEGIVAGEISAVSKAINLVPETGTSDTLDTVNDGYDGMVIILSALDSGDTITVSDGAGNLSLAGAFTINSQSDTLQLIYDSTLSLWLEASRSNNA